MPVLSRLLAKDSGKATGAHILHTSLMMAALTASVPMPTAVSACVLHTAQPASFMTALQDEMKALQRLNTAYFLTGYLGFTTTWVLSLIARIMAKPSLAAATDHMKMVLRVISPHYCFAQGLYDITSTYQGVSVVQTSTGGYMGFFSSSCDYITPNRLEQQFAVVLLWNQSYTCYLSVDSQWWAIA